MAAGFTMLKTLNENPEIFERLDNKTETLHQGMQEVLDKKGIPSILTAFL